jgi:ABC-type transporter Mla subunit MlaD
MATRKNEARLNLIVGAFVIGLGALGVLSIFIIGQGKGTWKEKALIYADFRQVSGLKKGSPVQLEGIEIGVVQDREFVELEYPCNPLTEDRGRFGQGRTDDCDRTMFCAPEGKCAELEPYSFNKDLHPPCEEDAQCRDDEVCVTSEFRRRYRRVSWTGNTGVCDGFTTDHKRIRVTLSVFSESLQHVREDSRATVSQNGLLGDQLVQISVGRGPSIPTGGRIQTTPSLIEELDNVKERVDGVFSKVEETIGGIAELASAMGDEKTIRNMQGLLANLNEVSRQVAEGKGLVGALLNDDAYVKDFGSTLRSVRDTASNLNGFVAKAKSSMSKIDDNLQPLVDDGRKVISDVSTVLKDLKDPNNKSLLAKVVYDPKGDIVKDLEETLDGVSKVVATIEKGDGTLGKLLKDPKAYDDLVKILGNIERNNTIKRLVRFVVEQDEAASGAAPTAKAPK